MKVIGFFVLLFSLSGCIMTEIADLGYFQIEPYAKPFSEEVPSSINLVILEDVKDTLLVEGEGLKKMKVTDFRNSFSEGMESLLKKNFESVNITNIKPSEGLSLVIYRVKPFWKINSRIPRTTQVNGRVVNTTSTYSSAAFQYESSLFLDKKVLSSADSLVYSDDEMMSIYEAHNVFKNGLLKTCESIHKELFNASTLEKLIQP